MSLLSVGKRVVSGMTLTFSFIFMGCQGELTIQHRNIWAADGKIFTEVTSLCHSQGHCVAQVDMVHVGKQNYYDLVNVFLEEVVSVAGERGTIVKEGVFCSTGLTNVEIEHQIPWKDLPGYGSHSLSDAVTTIESLSRSDIYRLAANVDDIQLDICQQKGQKKIFYRDLAERMDWTAQEEKLLFPSIAVESGDIDKGALTMYKNLALAIRLKLASNLDELERMERLRADPDFRAQIQAYMKISESIVHQERNEQLFAKVMEIFNQGQDYAILPWGAAHDELTTMLQTAGFALEKTYKIPFATCEEVINHPVRNAHYGQYCHEPQNGDDGRELYDGTELNNFFVKVSDRKS